MIAERPDCEALGDARHVLTESPVWCARSASLWWVDVRGPSLHRWHLASARIDAWTMPEVIGAVVVAEDEVVVVALKDALYRFDAAGGALARLATLEHDMPENRLNEAKADACGRIWCGSMWDYGAQTAGSLYRVGADRIPACLRGEITVPNGIAFAPDARTMYFADTRTGCIDSAPYDLATGTPGPWRTLVDAGVAPGRPDGTAVDADGCLWSARVDAGCIARFRPDGRLDRLLALPASMPTSCAFGGTGLDTLFVTTGRQRLSAATIAAEPLSGAVLALQPGVRGLSCPAAGAWALA